jgi:hypothetical protein
MVTAAEALQELGSKIGFEELVLNNEGVCALHVDNMEIFFRGRPDAKVLQISGVVGDLHTGGLVLARMLLELNWGGSQNGPSAFAADPVTGEVVLTRELSVDAMSREELHEAIEDFVTRVDFWARYFPSLESREGAIPPIESFPDEFFLRV